MVFARDEEAEMKYSISYEENPKPDDTLVLENGIMEYDKQNQSQSQTTFFAFFVRDEKGNIVGGCDGEIMYGHLYIGHVWVTETLRGQGFGASLMRAVEQLATDSRCHFMAVNTMEWQALDFYKRFGFFVEFERRGFDNDAIFYYLRKDLAKIN
jgi:ribosomal protein S18 acetylase RimI-like enzyme